MGRKSRKKLYREEKNTEEQFSDNENSSDVILTQEEKDDIKYSETIYHIYRDMKEYLRTSGSEICGHLNFMHLYRFTEEICR